MVPLQGEVAGVAYGFGVSETLDSNLYSNKWIGDKASRVARSRGGKVYTQIDVPIDPDVVVEFIEQEPGSPPPTLRIAIWAVRRAVEDGATELRVVAWPPHLKRALRDTRMVNFETGSPLKVTYQREINNIPEERWYMPDSIQERVRNHKSWRKRERILMMMPWWLYKIIAK